MATKTLLVAALLLAAACQAVSIKWTGYAANNQWDTNTNWYPDQIPGPQDDVTINSGDVIITTPVSVNSIGMGNSFSAVANLTVLAALTVFETLTVEGNGNLILTSGASTVSGTVNIDGTLVFASGTASGTWTLSKDATATLTTEGQKIFSACGFTAAGTVTASGVFLLEQSSTVAFTGLTLSGNFAAQAGDTSAVTLSATTLTYNGGGTLLVQTPVSITTFNFVAGNVTLIAGVTFGSALTVPAGSVLRAVAQSTVIAQAGVFGAGEIHALGSKLSLSGAKFTGTLIAEAGAVLLGGGSFGTILVNGAAVSVNSAVTAGLLTLNAGSIGGAASLFAQTLVLATPGFNLDSSVVVSGTATASSSVLALTSATGNIHVATGATLSVSGTVQFTDKGTFTNNGAVTVSGNLGITGVGVTGTGTFSVSGSLSLIATQFRASSVALYGTGSFVGQSTELFTIGSISNADGANGVQATIGEYTLTCPGGACKKVSTAGIPTSTFAFQQASA